ncbi:polymorphic toxin-type HINT domain-containing protein [Tautonia plasticadhaerens]|uniref:Hint domain-containing protein n=1 Tax=Tautonia plasticadhaerens TaxID=2527974 RepID=A0A518H523_9BACT|nr:polymorphic toxin-type HINT domain-containing protein [Tautonia plasticadhaerens]QDV35933.1 hypothetical protein ElP_38420 [Tautonia plasticadhaerens]
MMSATAIGPMLLVGLGLAIGGDSPGQVTPADDEAYRAASEEAGRDADAQVALALWCEANGRPSRASHHLALAVLIDPDHEGARGLMGQIRRGESWRRPSDAFPGPDQDANRVALREEYEGRRSRMDQTAEAHWDLGLWCEQNGLADEALAHFSAVTRIDPSREAAWKRIGYKKRGGRWMTDAQIAAERAEAEARDAAEAEWLPRLEQWARMLKDPARRGEAIAGLATVDHPLLVPAAWSTLVTGRYADQPAAAQVLGQIDARDASRALATLAVFTQDAEVRRIATETLKRRDAREWADLLIGMIRRPIQYSVRPVAGPGSAGELFVEGERYNRRRVYAAPSAPQVPILPGDQVVLGPDGLPVLRRQFQYSDWLPVGIVPFLPPQPLAPAPGDREDFIEQLERVGVDRGLAETALRNQLEHRSNMPFDATINVGRTRLRAGTYITGIRSVEIPVGQAVIEARQAAETVQSQLARDVAAIEAYNAPIKRLNERVVPVLEEAAGVRKGVEPEAWRAWYINQIGMRQVLPRPANGGSTFTDVVSVQPRPLPVGVFDQPAAVVRVTSSCFGKGTLVRTADGIEPIEAIEVGDLVLSQDPGSGLLDYRPVVDVHYTPSSATFDVGIGGETIVSSEFHRFWVAGRGWVMARDLRVGDPIRMLGGVARVESIEDGQEQPVYNIDVADHRSFFVGTTGALVHDFSLPKTTLQPFDAVPDLASLAEQAGPASGE